MSDTEEHYCIRRLTGQGVSQDCLGLSEQRATQSAEVCSGAGPAIPD